MKYLIILSLFWSLKGFSATKDVGCIFLIITPGARQVAMGSAFTAISDDAHALYYNDGGLGMQNRVSATLMDVEWLPALSPGMRYQYCGVVYPLNKITLGCQLIYINTGGTYHVDEEGNLIKVGETYDYSVKISCGSKITQSLSIGGGIKYIYSFLPPDKIPQLILKDSTAKGSGYGIAFDFGLLYKSPFPGLNYGISFKNIGLPMKMGKSKDSLPFLVRIGAAYKAVNTPSMGLLFAVDLTKVLVKIDEDFEEGGMSYIMDDAFKSFGIELETKFVEGASMCWRYGYFRDNTGRRVGYTLGWGIKLKGLSFDIGTDRETYVFPEEKNTRISLSYKL